MAIELSCVSQQKTNGMKVMTFALRGGIDTSFNIAIEEEFACNPMEDMTGPLLICLFNCMRSGERLIVHGPVSQWLLDRMEDYQNFFVHNDMQARALENKKPHLSTIDIIAEPFTFNTCMTPGRNLIATFSGGVDSSYGLWSCRKKLRSTLDISTAVFVQGYGGGSGPEVWNKVRIGPESLGYRASCAYVDLDASGLNCAIAARLAGLMRMMKPGFNGGVIFNDHSTDEVAQYIAWNTKIYGPQKSCWLLSYPWSWPNTMLSTPEFPVHNYGFQVSRWDKCRTLKEWNHVDRHLRTCWKKSDGGNCGQCEKCIYTALCFMTYGMDPPQCMPVPSYEKLDALWPPSEDLYICLSRMRFIAKNNGTRQDWVRLIGYLPDKINKTGMSLHAKMNA